MGSKVFAGDFEKEINGLGFIGGLVYGRLMKVIDGNRDFTVKWDIDSQISRHMS